MKDIEETTSQVERLYRSVTGQDPPVRDTPYAAIPPEKDPARHVEEQMERLTTALASVGTSTWAGPPWSPPITVCENQQEVVICAELSGVTRDNVEVVVMNNLLTITGQRTSAFPHGTQYRIRMTERPVGPFRRTVALPQGSLPEQLTAEMRDGLLLVRVPQAAVQNNSKTIAVK